MVSLAATTSPRDRCVCWAPRPWRAPCAPYPSGPGRSGAGRGAGRAAPTGPGDVISPGTRRRHQGETMGQLDGKVALVAGASRGIGKGAAIELGQAGAHVVVAGRTLRSGDGSPWGSLEGTVAEIEEAGGKATAIRCDFTD